jgi:hypothetical protein
MWHHIVRYSFTHVSEDYGLHLQGRYAKQTTSNKHEASETSDTYNNTRLHGVTSQ